MTGENPLTASTRTADTVARSPAGRHVHADSSAGGFAPGTVIGNRFRVIGLLGIGGMGEVYRADDLTLGQAVALKFLPHGVAADAIWRERLFSEVRLARQVSHPNVCRVYDVGEVEGRHFLSMEYIDGEDLASLIKRIGHLPATKVIELAHQLCAGLAAAHQRGVLHRDLKPRNVMIDGRGQVRITDFGLAVAIDRPRDTFVSPGTPIYMAPEQLAGKPASIRSDVYALGLVLYELSTGHQPFRATTVAALRIEKQEVVPAAPSELMRDVDPRLERAIMRCLERDPVARPASVMQVAATLPGGDALAATIAAGETPSPEMVAAAPTSSRFTIAHAALLVIGAAIAAALVIWLGTTAIVNRRVPLERPPEALVERARAMVQHAGIGAVAHDRAYGILYGDGYLQFLEDRYPTPQRWNALSADAVLFWYRHSPQPLRRLAFSIGVSPRITPGDPPLSMPDEAIVVQNGAGWLRYFVAMPPSRSADNPSSVEPDWGTLFADAGLAIADWRLVAATLTPPFWADRRVAWEPSAPLPPVSPIRVEAASVGARIVSFQVISPWDLDARRGQARLFYDRGFGAQSAVPGARFANLVGIGLTGVAMFGGLVFARRNLRLGRGDRRGASRLAVFITAMLTASWLLDEHHLADAHQWYLLMTFAGRALVVAGIVWWTYVAFEPFVRRHWPEQLVSWNRVLSGAVRDPLVGRDVLIGCAAGAALTALVLAGCLLPGWLGWPAERLASPTWHAWLAPRHAVSLGLQLVCNALLEAFTALFLVVLTRIVVRLELAAALIAALLLATPDILLAEHRGIAAPVFTMVYFLGVMVLLRVGLLAVIALRFCVDLLQVYPITFDTSAWYAGMGWAALLVFAIIVTVSVRLALAMPAPAVPLSSSS